MNALFLLVFVIFISAENSVKCDSLRSGEIVCSLCKSLIETLSKLDGHRVKDYINTLCAKASGFIATVCTKIVDFGIDKLVELIREKIEPEEVCIKIHLC